LGQISDKENISDIHLSTDEYIAFRINGEIKKITRLLSNFYQKEKLIFLIFEQMELLIE